MKKPVRIDRVDVSLAYVGRILDFAMSGTTPLYSLHSHRLWTATKTTAFEVQLFPANGMIEVVTGFTTPAEDALRRGRDEAHECFVQRSKGDTVERERTLLWQVQIDTVLTDGSAVHALFSVPSGT